MEVKVKNDITNQLVPTHLIDNEDNTYTVELTPDLSGTYTTTITYGGVSFNKKTTVISTVDVNKVQVAGLEQSELIYSWNFLPGCS